MSKAIYPIIIHPAKEGGYWVDIPDLKINTQGETIPECIDMARDAIGLMGIDLQDSGQTVPAPSVLSPACAAGDIVTLVDIDFDAYRRANDLRSVRKNVTLPSWLNFEAEKAGINFSAVLQAALKNELHLSSR